MFCSRTAGLSCSALEQLDSRVAEVHDTDVAVRRHTDPAGPVKLARPGALRAELPQEDAARGKHLGDGMRKDCEEPG